MESIKVTRLYDHDISESIRKLIAESSNLKSNIFKSFLKEENVDLKILKTYKNYIRDFVDSWEDYSEDLAERIKSSKGVVGVQSIDYSFAKEFIYAKDDYASILPFTDGVIKGIHSEKFKNPDEVEDFFVYTVQKAFNNRGKSTAALLDSVMIDGANVDVKNLSTDHDAKLFDSVKSYSMFDSTSSKELIKAIEKTIEYITSEIPDAMRELKYKKPKLFISMINNVIEYITYSITAYVTRIYVISRYVYPYIDKKDIKPVSMVSESGNNTELDMNDIYVHIMHDYNEADARDYKKYKNFIEEISSFVKSLGGESLSSVKPSIDISYKCKDSTNVIISELIGNSLFEFLTGNEEVCRYDRSYITELNHMLKEFMYNTTHAYQPSYTPKHEILHVIRGSKYKNTIEGYQNLARDVYFTAMTILGNIWTSLNCITSMAEHQSHNLNTTEINDVAENIKMLKDLYSEFAVVFLHKCRDIEIHFNNTKNDNLTKISKTFVIDIPGVESDINSDDNMMSSVPYTTRLPMDLMDVYDAPTFESLEMYDEYVRSLPGMEDDGYLCEATNISSIINAIMSRIKSIFERFVAFINDKRFSLARKWVLEHANQLKSLNFDNKELNVLPYKKDVTLPEGFKNLMNNLKKFDENTIKTNDSKKAFIKSLYPSEEIYNWFYGENSSNGPEMYRNHILFYDLKDPVKKEVPNAVAIKGTTLHAAVENWINTMNGAPNVLNEFKSIKTEIENSINGIKNKIVSIQNETKKSEDEAKKENTPPTTSTNSNNNSNTEAKPIDVPDTSTGNVNNDNSSSGHDAFLVEIQTTIMRLWGSLTSIFIHYYLTQYKYLKDAYAIGRNVSDVNN